ncbi:MAG: glutamate 5-kinase, partial [Propionibacteriaceae bacterium]|nr:glutamate 5-kinase [Propionibacteriaceae bacterium]
LAAADQVDRAIRGESIGTFFHPNGKRRSRKLLWLAYASQAQGELVLDAGAVQAVVQRNASLLPAGILAVRGDFQVGDPVRLVAENGKTLARGLVGYDSAELPLLIGKKTADLVQTLGPEFNREVVHRDDLILKKKRSQ